MVLAMADASNYYSTRTITPITTPAEILRRTQRMMMALLRSIVIYIIIIISSVVVVLPPSTIASLPRSIIIGVEAATSPRQQLLAFNIPPLSSKSSSIFTTKTTSSLSLSSCSNNLLAFFPRQYQPQKEHVLKPQHNTGPLLTMKVSGSNKRTRVSKSSRLIELNNERLQVAGRPGTKKFMDPTKIFIGNLPYDATEVDIYSLFSQHWNTSVDSVRERIESVKIIRDWKTGVSKGYGFIQFYEPMMATSAMESVNSRSSSVGGDGGGLQINGRKIRLDQGKRKKTDEDEEVERKRRLKKEKNDKKNAAVLDEEGRAIYSALEDIEGSSSSSVGKGSDGEIGSSLIKKKKEQHGTIGDDSGLGMSEDDMITFMEKGGLRGVMPLTVENAGFLGMEGLYVADEEENDDDGFDFEGYYNENGYNDADYEDIDLEDDSDDEDANDEEIVYDGVFEEMYNPNEYEGLTEEEEASMQLMNREQRRAAEKRRKKRKLPFKGFGRRQ